jgi:hypothetical protein
MGNGLKSRGKACSEGKKRKKYRMKKTFSAFAFFRGRDKL